MERVKRFNEKGQQYTVIEFSEEEDEILRQGWSDPQVSWHDMSTTIGCSVNTLKRRGTELGLGDFVASNPWHHIPGYDAKSRTEAKAKQEALKKNRWKLSDVIEGEIDSAFKALGMEYVRPETKDGRGDFIGTHPLPKDFHRAPGISKGANIDNDIDYVMYEVKNKQGNFECVLKLPVMVFDPKWTRIVTKEKQVQHLRDIERRALSMVTYLQFIEWSVYDMKGIEVLHRTPSDYFKTDKELREQKARFFAWKMRVGDTLRVHGRKQMEGLVCQYMKEKERDEKASRTGAKERDRHTVTNKVEGERDSRTATNGTREMLQQAIEEQMAEDKARKEDVR